MLLHNLASSRPRQKRSRVGRGIAAGQGKTAGRGTKGQKSRAGYNLPRKFEGGQTPLTLRLPKARGFKRARPAIQIVDRAKINHAYQSGETVSPSTLVAKGLIGTTTRPVKILGREAVIPDVIFEDVRQSRLSHRDD